MIFKLMEAAEGRWRKLTGAYLVALVRVGVEFKNGELVEGTEEAAARTREALIDALGKAISAVNSRDALGFFEHSGYRHLSQLL